MSSGTFKQFLFPLVLAGFALVFQVHAQDDQSGFISIDCGLPAESSNYTETATTIRYISDVTFIDTGEAKSVPGDGNNYRQPFKTLRSFPNGTRNCYRINVTSASKYIIRAYFYYGNYDGKNEFPKFDLHLGNNFWGTISSENTSLSISKEVIHYIPEKRNYLHVCLVNTGSGTPIISIIELRLLPDQTYQTDTGSLEYYFRVDTGRSPDDDSIYRNPNDIYDRLWIPYQQNDWTQLKTSSPINIDNNYKPASVVMSTAATLILATDNLTVYWKTDNESLEFYVYMHFAELEKLPANQSRQLEIYINGELFKGPLAPFEANYLSISTAYSTMASTGALAYTLNVTGISDLPPILNAIEVYTVKVFSEAETDIEDVNVITTIKSTYKMEKNWQGDPCFPKEYSWEGLTCNYTLNDSARIISLDLSSSGLTGEIDASISELIMIQTLNLSNNSFTGPIPDSLSTLQHLSALDLSYNNLTGPIPNSLSTLQNLSILNLENNMLTGSIPNGLNEKTADGTLSLRLCNNQNISGNISCEKKKKKKQSPLIPVIGGIIEILVLLIAVLVYLWHQKSKAQPDANPTVGSMETKKRTFTYSEILKFTNSFERVLGRGGFGVVYHGYVNKTQVAVKMLSSSSIQGSQQFYAEVDLLVRVHHTNLTNLVGYCNDEANLALVYEYMANGNLQEHLSVNSLNVLTMESRLQIATDAAQGLEYLHYGCRPPIVHRDVKSANILLNENFRAKVSDFGLSRDFPTDGVTHLTTSVAGTPGYLDPEYYLTSRLNEKSDVYSFGIVLLEIITSRPVIAGTQERINITQWVGFMLAKGDIYNLVDPRLERNFNVNAVWKAVEIAMACVAAASNKRPTMSKVVAELKECLEIQLHQTNQGSYETAMGDSIEMVSQNDSIMSLGPSPR